MKKQLLLLFIIIQISTFGQTMMDKKNQINNDTTWSSDTVKVYCDIVVGYQATLSIDPGVFVEFQGNYSIDIYGKIMAIGELYDSIFFTINDTTGFADTSVYDGGWGSIKLLENSYDTSVFSFCKFSFGKAVFPGHYYLNPDYEDNMGGAIYANEYAKLVIDNSYFFYNKSNFSGGAIHIENANTIKINNNEFIRNYTFYHGGAVKVMDSDSLNVNFNLFYKNTATFTSVNGFRHGVGGGLSIHLTYANIINNRFYNNNSVGGALYESSYKCNIINNIIANNMGRGLFSGISFGVSKYYNNTIVNNETSVQGPGIVFHSEDIEMINNIVWGNDNWGSWPDPIQVYSLDPIIADLSFSCIQDGYEGEGNIESYPEFVNPTEGAGLSYDGLAADWTLLDSSPCINNGTPDTTDLNLPEFDITGNPRIFGGRIDMGAYENQNVYVKINDSPIYSKIKIYPNPGTDKIYIDIPPEINGAWIDIVDGQGRVLMHEQVNFIPAILSPYKLTSGIYFYRIYNENKVVKSGKWVKR